MKTNKVILTSVMLILLLLASTASATTLNVGSKEKYKTIQSAVNAAIPGDIIQVASGTYKENVKINKELYIVGTKYPNVYGFYYDKGKSGTINGFTITKKGVTANNAGANAIIRNNYFNNCGITLQGKSSYGVTIMNNQIKGGTVALYNTYDQTLKGNTISNSKYGLYVGDKNSIPTVTKNTFKNCNYGVYLYGWKQNPGKLVTFTDNSYIKNKVNIGWGMNKL
jgi:parallel beta-helix repeat protein